MCCKSTINYYFCKLNYNYHPKGFIVKEEKDRQLTEDSGRIADSYAPDPPVREDQNVFTLDDVLGVVSGINDENSQMKAKLELIKKAARKGMSNGVILKIAETESKRTIKNGAMLVDISNSSGGSIHFHGGDNTTDDDNDY